MQALTPATSPLRHPIVPISLTSSSGERLSPRFRALFSLLNSRRRSNSSMSDGAGEETVHVADTVDDNPLWTADFPADSDAQSALQNAVEQGRNSSSDEDD